MTEPTPQHHANGNVPTAEPIPRRAANLARRLLDLERQCGGRGRLAFEVVFLDGEWLLFVSKPGPLERLGE